jgi:hypothetical protein
MLMLLGVVGEMRGVVTAIVGFTSLALSCESLGFGSLVAVRCVDVATADRIIACRYVRPAMGLAIATQVAGGLFLSLGASYANRLSNCSNCSLVIFPMLWLLFFIACSIVIAWSMHECAPH